MENYLNDPAINITNDQILAVDYFYDFITFIKYLSSQSIQRTITGNISRFDIEALSDLFKNGERLKYLNREMGWKVRSENDVMYLQQIKVTAEVMYLTYKRKNRLLLSKSGRYFLANLEPKMQYEQMVLWFWNRVNWEYTSPGRSTAVIQNNQRSIWRSLYHKNNEWINFKTFCLALKDYLGLKVQVDNNINSDFDLMLDVRYGLFERNLKLFGCVETEMTKDEYGFDEIKQFRSTAIGLYMYREGLKPF